MFRRFFSLAFLLRITIDRDSHIFVSINMPWTETRLHKDLLAAQLQRQRELLYAWCIDTNVVVFFHTRHTTFVQQMNTKHTS